MCVFVILLFLGLILGNQVSIFELICFWVELVFWGCFTSLMLLADVNFLQFDLNLLSFDYNVGFSYLIFIFIFLKIDS